MDGIPIFTVFCLIIYAGTTEAAAACNSVFSTSQNVQNFGYNATSETSGNEADKVFSAGWCAGNPSSPFIDVDFKQTFGISSITVARPTNQNNVYAESVMVQYVPNGGNTFEHFQIGGPLLIMSLNSSLTSTTTAFSHSFVIKKLRFTILKSVGSPCMKIDLTGCNSDLVCTGGCLNGGLCMMTDTCQCQPGYTGQNCEIKETHCVPQSLGLGNGTIKPDQITVSSEESPHTKDQLGLDNAKIGWCAGPSDPAPYVQVKLDEPKAVSIFHFGKIKRQPGEDDKFMREFELQYIAATDSAKQFRTFAQNIMAINGTHTFTIMIEPAVVTDTIRIVASRVEKRACFRLEIEGCDPKALCTPNFCMNGGTCMGENVCSCPSNYFGVRCDQTKTDIVATNLTFVSITNNVIITTSTTIHFMVTGHVTLSTINSRPAVTINGANSYITLNSTSQGSSCITDINHCTNGYTFAVDLNFANIVDNTYILSSGGNLPGYSGVALYYSNHKLYYIVSTSTQKWTLVVNYTPVFNKWQHFEITWNPSLGVELLVNSVSLGSNSQPVQQPIANKVVELCIGCSHTTSVNVNVNMHVTGVISWTIDRTELVNAGVKPPPVTATTPHTPSTVTTVKESTSTSTRLTSSTATPPKTPSIPVTSPTSNASSTLQTTEKETTVTPTTSMAPTTNTIPDTTTSAIPVTTAVSGGTTSTNPVTTMPLTSTLKTTATTLKESTTANVQTTSSTPKVTTEEKTTVTTPPTTTEDKVLTSSTISTGQSTPFTVVDNKTTTLVTTKAPPTSVKQTTSPQPPTSLPTTSSPPTTSSVPTTSSLPYQSFNLTFITIINHLLITPSFNFTLYNNPKLELENNSHTALVLDCTKHQYVELPDQGIPCLESLNDCKNGFTFKLEIMFTKIDVAEKTYIVSSGGDVAGSSGMAIYLHSNILIFGVKKGIFHWTGTYNMSGIVQENVWYKMEISWNQDKGIKVLIDGFIVILETKATPSPSNSNTHPVLIGKTEGSNYTSCIKVRDLFTWTTHREILVDHGVLPAAQTSTMKPTTTVATTTPTTTTKATTTPTTTTKATTTPTTTIPTTTEAPIPTFTWNFTTIVGNIIIGNTYNLTIHGTPIVINGGLQINTTTNYIEFGKHPDNVCLTNPAPCFTGLTIQFNVQFNKFSENTYFLTSGGQLPDGVGLAVIYRFGRVQFVLTTETNSWFISVHKNTFTSNVYNNVMVSWNITSGLELFVNNVLVIGNKIPTPHQSFLNNVTTVYIGKQPTTNIKVDFVIQTIIIWHAHIDILVEKGICQPPQRPTDAPVTTTSKPTTSKPASSPAPSASSSLTSLVTSPITTQQCPVGCVSAGPTTDKPTTEKPTTSKPTTEKPTTEKPTTAKPTTAKPTTAKPTTAKPTTTVPTTTRSTIPNFTSKPNLHVVVEKDNMAYLACVFKASMEKGVQVTAQLLVDGKMVLQKIVPGNTGLVMFSVAEVNMFMNKLEIKCTVKASFMGSSVSTQTYPSQVFIPQITVSPGTMVVVEGHTKEFFTVTSTAPPHFYCCTGCKGQCQVHVVGSFEYNRYYQKCGRDVIAQSLIEGNKPPNYNEHICGFALTATSWNINKLYVKATIDNRRDGDHRNQMTITAQVYNQPITAQITVKPNSFTVTTVQVTAKDNDRSVQCKSLNDPHLTTFDGKRFNNMFEGNFILYRHKTLPFEVRANYYKCSKKSHATCNCAVSVKSGDDIISVFGCQGTVSTHPGQGHGIGLVLQQLFGSHGHAHGHGHGHDELAKTPMTIQIFKNGELTPGTYIRRYGCGQKYEIELPTGMIVTVQQSWKPFINIWIKASSSDRHNTEGLCGDNDGNSGNDVKPNVNAYNNHWKVQPNENFFYGVSASSIVVATSMYCSCVQGRNKICLEGLGVMRCSTSKYDITAALVRQAKLPILGNGNNGNNGNNRRYKRQVTNPPSTNIPVVDPDITFEEAEDRCREAILGSSVKKSCEPVLSSNFSAQIENCAHDYNATGNFEWSQDALRDIVVDCVETVNDFKAANESGNTNVTDEITLPDDLDDILLNICLEDCGEFGNCTDGVCICEPGYSGVNCSISKETVPSVSNVPYLCDITQTTDCMAAVVIGDNFVESDHLTCHFEYIEVTDTISSTGETGSSTAAYISLNQVICQLPRLRSALISVSNDGQQKSTDKTTYVAFDSVCYDCVDTNTTGPTCSRKDNNCIINGVCYAADVTKPGNNCQKCRPAVNESVWSQNDIDECKPVPVAQTTTSNDDDKTKILILAIVCGVLAAIVLIGFLCLIKAKCSKKNPKNIYGAYEITPENKFHREIATTNMAYDDKL